MKMEIELTEEQAEKVKILEENDISVGEAIDMLFDMKEKISVHENRILDARIERANQEKAELEARLERVDEELSIFDRLKDSTLDVEEKQRIIEKEYGDHDEGYDRTIQDLKHEFKWSTKFFKF